MESTMPPPGTLRCIARLMVLAAVALTLGATGGCTVLLPFDDPPPDAQVDAGVDGEASPCGNGKLDPGEECDDATANSDTEPDACRMSCSLPRCGDGVIDTNEECDDATANSDSEPDACRTSCSQPFCGDGVSDTGEECDDATANSDSEPDACRMSCSKPGCGDGVIDTGEECDDATANSDTEPNACRSTCVSWACGDGVLDVGEGCDDGNTTTGDGCDSDCAPLPCDSVESLVYQFGCGAGEACDVDSTQGITCRAAGSTPDYSPCSSATDCGAGATCVKIADTKRCHPFCSVADLGTATGVPPGRGVCLDTLSTSAGTAAVRVQEVACDPASNSGCGGFLNDSACYIVSGFTFCLPSGLRLGGQTCDPLDQICLAKYYCTSSGGTCQRTCHLPDSGDCPLGKHCTGTTGNSAYGYCQ